MIDLGVWGGWCADTTEPARKSAEDGIVYDNWSAWSHFMVAQQRMCFLAAHFMAAERPKKILGSLFMSLFYVFSI